ASGGKGRSRAAGPPEQAPAALAARPPSWLCPAARAGGPPAPDRAGPPRVWAPPGTPWQGLSQAGIVGRVDPAFQKPPVPSLPPVAPLSSPPLPHPAHPVQAALRLALERAGGAAASRWARGQSYGRGVDAGRRCWEACGRGGSAKRPL